MLTVVVVGSGAPVVTASSVKLNMPSPSVLFFSVFFPLMIALPAASYVFSSVAIRVVSFLIVPVVPLLFVMLQPEPRPVSSTL